MSTSLSQDFINNVRVLYHLGLDEICSGKVVRYGINGYTIHAAPAYVSAIASLEAFVNETLLGIFSKSVYQDSALWMLDSDWIEKLELKQKLIIVPQLLFSQTFKRNELPFQDMQLLFRIRNDVVHYRMKFPKDKNDLPKYVNELEKRKIALSSPEPDKGDFIWVHKICTTEGIRWANNTICKTVHKLVDFVSDMQERNIIFSLASNFREIPESFPKNFLKQMGIED